MRFYLFLLLAISTVIPLSSTMAVADNNIPAGLASSLGLIQPALPPSNNPPATQPETVLSPDLIEVVAQGMGIDVNAALLNAYSNAVQQALGLYVDAETLVQNDQVVQDKILTYSKGFIQEAEKLKESQTNGLFQVNIRAKVKRQQLLEQAKANNISVKAVDGVSLHAKVETQLKQEQDAKELLEKTLLPLIDATLLRAELIQSTQEQPNPTINKEGTNDQFVTLDYKVSLWIDESEYYKYVKNTLIPILNQIAVRKGELTVNFKQGYKGHIYQDGALDHKEKELKEKDFLFGILTLKDKALTAGKWQWFFVQEDQVPEIYRRRYGGNSTKITKILCKKIIELDLLDEKSEIVALGNSVVAIDDSCINSSTSPIVQDHYLGRDIRISPFLSTYNGNGQGIVPPKSGYFTISVKIPKEDIPHVKSAKLEVKSTEGE